MDKLFDLGLNEHDLESSREKLTILLANEYFLYIKTLNYHWNITGENFIAMHKLLEQQYEWLKETVDEVAERIRTLGFIAPADLSKYAKVSDIGSGDETETENNMLTDLVNSHLKVIHSIRSLLKSLDSSEDYATADMFIKILGHHEKIVWMIRCHLNK